MVCPGRSGSNRAMKVEIPPFPARSSTPATGILADITAGLATGGELGPLLERFLDPIMRLAGAQAGALRVLSGVDDRLQLVCAREMPERLCSAGDDVDRHCGFCGSAADGQDLVWASDLSGCSRRSGSDFFGRAYRCLLAVPLRHRGRTLGVYTLFFDGGPEPAAEVQAILRSVGELLGLALNNARLEQEHLQASLLSERQSMAAEVHDALAQSLAFAKMRMPLLHDAMLAHDDRRAQQYYDDVRQAMTQAHASLRGIITHLRSPMDPQGLVHALQTCADHFRRSTGAGLVFVNRVPELSLPEPVEVQVFHIVKEALTNVARHAGARQARLQITEPSAGVVEILVEDDGAGIPPRRTEADDASHYGMDIMVERARRIGGTLEIGERPGGGTRVRLALPLPADPEVKAA